MSDVSMMPIVVLIVCKTVLAPPSSEVDAANSAFTRHENRPWAYEGSMMVCRRHEVQMFDSAEAQGADPLPFNHTACIASAIRLGAQWDIDHAGTKNPYRTWRVACPTPIFDVGPDGIKGNRDDKLIGYQLPDCGHRDTVICEGDTVI